MTPEEVKEIRRKLGLSQSQLALQLGCIPLTVSRWERGERKIPGPSQAALRLLLEKKES